MQNIFTSRINIKVTINVAFNVFEDVFIDLSSVLMNMFESKQNVKNWYKNKMLKSNLIIF